MAIQVRSIVSLWLLVLVAGLSGCRTSPEAKEASFLKRGQALLAQKDYPRAIIEFRNAATAMPKDAEPHYQMGMAYLESGDTQSAVRAFQKATSLNPKHQGAQLKLAEFMAVSRNEKLVEEAVTRLSGTFGASPDNAEVIDTLAIAEWRLGRQEAATQRLETALTKFPTHLQSSVTLARMKLSRNDRNGAEEVLKKAVADAPQSAAAALALGELYIIMQQPAKGEVELKRALQLDPKNGPVMMALGAVQIAARRFDEAERVYKQLAALHENPYKPIHAMFLYQFGKREAAVQEFETLFKAEPNDREARSRLVAAYVGLNRLSEAESVLAAALKANAKDTEALLQRAELRLKTGKEDDAEKDLKTVIHFNPDSAAAHFLLARAYQIKGSGSNQQQELQQVLKLDPAMLQARLALEASYLGAKQAQAALDVMDEAPEQQKTTVPWMLGRNSALLSLGNLNEVRAGIDRVLQQERVPEAVYQDAVLRLLKKDFAGARAGVNELLKLGITNPNVIEVLMQTYAAQKDLTTGLEVLKEVASTQPKSAGLQQSLGQWYQRAGNPVAARKAFESAKALDAHVMTADLSLADLDLQEGQIGAARQRLAAIIAAEPKNLPAQMLLARAQNGAGDRTGEIETYRSILALDPSNLIALNNLAYALALTSPDEALTFAQRAVERAPGEPSIQDTLGWIYYRKGLYGMAVGYLKTAVEKGPTPRRQFHLGMCYVKTGDQITGQKLVKDALQKEPSLVKTEQGW